MRRFVSVAVISLIFTSAGPYGQGPAPDTPIESATDASSAPTLDESPAGWFVELASPPTIDGTAVETLDAEEVQFHAAAARAGFAYTETAHFRAVWNGLTIETTADENTLRSVPGVVAVYPVVTAHRSQQDDAPLDVADMVTALEAGGADVAQQDFGLSGRGVRVAVLDSGIDYDHPDLGGCFGPDCRVAKGWDFVGDAFNPDRTAPSYNPVAVPDADPDDCDGHGTHVAGIIGANGTIRGVAPEVTLHAYRVFGCVGPTTTDVILAAMERAYKDGADILNMSLGAPYQWPQYPTAASAARLVKNGLIVVASGGNEGSENGRNGMYAADAPGIGNGVISVASFDNTFANLSSAIVMPGNQHIGYLVATGSPVVPTEGSAPLARTGTAGSPADACTPIPAGSLTGRIALVRRGGTCGFAGKAANVQAAGAIGAVIYNNVPGRISISVVGPTAITIPVVSISATDGVRLDSLLAAGPLTFTWTSEAVSEVQATANLISSFSSFGPTAELGIKPDLGAPGGAIRSTLPLERGSFGTISGTSMAAPYVAGAIALLLEAHPDLSAGDALARLQNTARPRPWSGNPTLDVRELVHRQGAGLISVDGAVRTEVEVRPSRLALGDFEEKLPAVRYLRLRALDSRRHHGRRRHRHGRDWHDDSDCDVVTYTPGHEPAVATGARTFGPIVLPSFATVEFSEPEVTVGGGHGDGTIKVLITPPTDNTSRLFGGYLTFKPDDGGPVLSVPYLGYNGDYQEIQALTPTTAGFPWLAKIAGSSLARQGEGALFNVTTGDTPLVVFHLDHQVQRLRAEAINIDTGQTYPIDDQEYVGRNSSPVSFFVLTWDGTFTRRPGAPVRLAPSGNYQIAVSALKALGSKRKTEDTERWNSPTFAIVR